jgi:hypothetical protein
MDRTPIANKIKEQYNEIFPHFFDSYKTFLENPSVVELYTIYRNHNYNIKYLEDYLSLLEITDDNEMIKAFEKHNMYKQITDCLYLITKKNENIDTSKYEICSE